MISVAALARSSHSPTVKVDGGYSEKGCGGRGPGGARQESSEGKISGIDGINGLGNDPANEMSGVSPCESRFGGKRDSV